MISAKRLFVILFVLMLVAFSMDASAAINVIVEVSKDADINSIAAKLGGTVLDSMPDDSKYLLSLPSMPPGKLPPDLSIPGPKPPGVKSMRLDVPMTLPRFRGSALSATGSNGSLPWYANQPAFNLINCGTPNSCSNSLSAQAQSTGRGVIIADIDAQVDVSHPALRGHLTTGYDFIGNSGGANTQNVGTLQQSTSSFLDQSTSSFLDQSTSSFLDQSTSSFLDQSTSSFLDQSTSSFLDQSTSSFLDQSTSSFLDQSSASFLESGSAGHGHGTMVAGILAALAPDALIMPLRAFDDSGMGDAFQVAKAIRYAVRNGAQVINLSLGFSANASEVSSAIDFATAHNVVVVAAAGNSGSSQPQYPAAYNHVIGVGSTDLHDVKATFSNYGDSVFVMAPGVNIITAYPGGYALASGTSFSCAMAAAEVALIQSLTTTSAYNTVGATAVNIDSLNRGYAHQLGYGRIDVLAAVLSAGGRTPLKAKIARAGASVSSEMSSVTSQDAASRNISRYIVRFRPGTGNSDRAVAAARVGARVRFNYDIVESIAIEVPAPALQGLLNDPNVIEIVPDRAVFSTGFAAAARTTSSTQVTPSGVSVVGLPATGSDGSGVGVAIVDTGIDLANLDLAVALQSYSAFGLSCADDNGHGTGVASLVSALNNTIGIVGVAPNSKPYCVKVLDSTGTGSDSSIIAGLNWIYTNWNLVTPNIKVVNMSLGRPGTIGDDSSYRTAVQQLYNLGIVVVNAAGNDSTVEVTSRVPGTYPEVFAVASTPALKGTTSCRSYAAIVASAASYYTTDGAFSPTTNMGITISAPGEDSETITSTCGISSVGMVMLQKGGGTMRGSGTSVSAPLVAGIVARLIQKGNTGVENIRSKIRSTAQLVGYAPYNSPYAGYTFDGQREGIAKAP